MAKLSDLRVGDIVQVAKMAEGFTLNDPIVGAIGVVVDTSGDASLYENVVGVNWIATPPGRWVFRQQHPTFDYSFGMPTETSDYEFTIISRSEEAVRDVKVGDIVAFTINDNSGHGGFGVVTYIGRSGIPYPIEIRFIATDWTKGSSGLITMNEITQVISQVPHEQG